MEPNLRLTYLAELAERIEDFSAIWPRFVEECALFDKPNRPQLESRINRWRVRKYAAELLSTAAQIGRILDPAPRQGSERFKATCRARGDDLRKELHIPTDSPLLDRRLRNALEHIDEHIDAWVADDPNRPLETWAFATTEPGEASLEPAIRRIHVRTYDVFVLERRANLAAVRNAIDELHANLPPFQKNEMMLRIDDPKSGQSDVIVLHRVLSAGESTPPAEPHSD
jgi:hypothetical protein